MLAEGNCFGPVADLKTMLPQMLQGKSGYRDRIKMGENLYGQNQCLNRFQAQQVYGLRDTGYLPAHAEKGGIDQ